MSVSVTSNSIGNYFLAAAQIFFRSLPSAIFLFSSITNSQAMRFTLRLSLRSLWSLPGNDFARHCHQPYSDHCSWTRKTSSMFCWNHWHALQENGSRLVGQCEISHPVRQSVTTNAVSDTPLSLAEGLGERPDPRQNMMFEQQAKNRYESLVAPISSKYLEIPIHEFTWSFCRAFLHKCLWYGDSSNA